MATGMSANVSTHWTGTYYEPWRKIKGTDIKPSMALEKVEFKIDNFATYTYPDEGAVSQLYMLDVGTVRKKASSYRTLAGALDSCVTSTKEARTALEGAWEGAAAIQVNGRISGQLTLLDTYATNLKFVAGCLEGLARCVEEIRASWLREPTTGLVYRP